MHKILIQTELPRLRHLGYEVFCPAYRNRSLQHQSASNGWSETQPTTLPPEVFHQLSDFDFFYQEIPQNILDLLNRYFEAVIVTIDPAWLIEVLKGYKGKVIYRTFGHVENMSNYLYQHNAMPSIVERDNFWYFPHAAECALHEHHWLRSRMEVVPYCVTLDATTHKDQWDKEFLRNEIMVSCPNISNPYYRAHYQYLKNHFSDSAFRLYGVQPFPVDDPQIVGSMSFSELLSAYTHSAGFLYTYREPTVCFLPPIEMMIAGGPVIFFKDSLLDQYFAPESELAPGRAQDEIEALEKCAKLLPESPSYDAAFVRSVIDSQAQVRRRYLPEDVWPRFDQVFTKILDPSTKNLGSHFLNNGSASPHKGPGAVVDAFTGNFTIKFYRGHYSAEDFDRNHLVRIISRALAEHDRVLFLCHWHQLPLWHGLLGEIPGLLFQPVDRPLLRRIDRILYSAESPRGRLFFALTHPNWLLLKIKTLLRVKVFSLKSRIPFGDQRKLVFKFIKEQTEVFLVRDEQAEFYHQRGLKPYTPRVTL
jgi:hypothetical protein